MRNDHREARQKLPQSQCRQKRDYIFNRSIVLGQSKIIQTIWPGPWMVIQAISSVLYRIVNRKRSMVAHHDSLQLCSDRDLPIWLRRKRHELTGTLGEDVGDRVLEQATDAMRHPDEYGEGDNLDLEDLYAEMTEEGLEQRHQTQEMYSSDKASPDVLNDDNHELFEDYMEIDNTQREIIKTRGGRVITRHMHLDDYWV